MDDTNLSQRPLSRRTVLKAGAIAGIGAAAGGLLVACNPSAASPAASATAAPSTGGGASPAASEGPLAAAELELWYQDWDPLTNAYVAIKAAVEAKQPNIKLKLTKLPYEQLQTKLLPSIAAGKEPELMMAYSSWLVATDVSKLFSPIAPDIMTADEAKALFYPSALTEGLRGDGLYYMPFLNGMGGSTFTYNVDILAEAKIDPATLTTWDALVEAGKKLVKWDGASLARAGIAFSPYIASAWVSGIGQLGAKYFDAATGKFDLTSAVAQQSLKNLDDLLKVHKVDDIAKEAPSHANLTGYGAPDGFEKGLAAITNMGGWIVSGYEKTSPNFKAGTFPMPPMGTSTSNIELSHSAVHLLSKRLASDPAKKAAAKFVIGEFASAANLGPLADVYGGAIISAPVARDAATQARHWGNLQKQYDETVWPLATFEEHHIPDWGITIAWPQLVRVFKDSEPMDAVLKDLEDQSNQLEQQARERLAL